MHSARLASLTALCAVLALSCGAPGAGADAGTAGLERCATTGGPAPLGDQHFELVPSGVRPGSALRVQAGEPRLVEGGPVISYTDYFTQTAVTQPASAAPLTAVARDSTRDDLAVLLDPRVVSDFETVYAFTRGPTGQALTDYRAAVLFDPASQLSVRVGASSTDFFVSGQSVPTELRPWTAGDTLVGGVRRFLIADATVTFDFEGDGACHLRNLTRILKPEGPLALSHFFSSSNSAGQLEELQRYLVLARPRARLTTLRSNGPAFTNLFSCDLASLETCRSLTQTLVSALNQWLSACPVPTDLSLRGAPETCRVEGALTLRPYP